ncbi:DUF998 domain-containing protein [Halopiger aswanensis]|uniref:Putative membrane protein n=1 Tax=Halopiger aswanensis TaxID=148449 RepID=A0A3R7GWG1_9EURY|nr:DUF998 domain-containing protein [Halopiger aswanensis]RKD95664.1 putative membrane protein [Halopiger aswanensis]
MGGTQRRRRPRSSTAARVATHCGLAAAVVGLGAVLLATVIAAPETFTWRGAALSDMGRYGTRTFPLFNGGLVLSGLLGVPFGWRLWHASETALERVGVALLVVATIGLVGVGVFFLGHTEWYLERSFHGPAALTYFAAAPLAQWCYGTGAVLAGRLRRGLVSIWLAVVHPLAWLGWLSFLVAGGDAGAWFAVPEFVAAVAFGAWIGFLAVDLEARSRPGDAA